MFAYQISDSSWVQIKLILLIFNLMRYLMTYSTNIDTYFHKKKHPTLINSIEYLDERPWTHSHISIAHICGKFIFCFTPIWIESCSTAVEISCPFAAAVTSYEWLQPFFCRLFSETKKCCFDLVTKFG